MTKQRFALKGMGGPGIPLDYKIGKAKGLNAPLVMLGVDDGKQQIMNRLTIDKPGPMFFHFPEDEEGIMQNRGYDNLYFRGLISEHRKTVKRNGVYRQVWEPTQGIRNEPLDLRNYNLACMLSLHPDWVALKSGMQNLIGDTKPALEVKQTGRKSRAIKASSRTSIW
ncbi:MAG: terminase gpA endonuclease subunit [Acidaminococcus intestini]